MNININNTLSSNIYNLLHLVKLNLLNCFSYIYFLRYLVC